MRSTVRPFHRARALFRLNLNCLQVLDRHTSLRKGRHITANTRSTTNIVSIRTFLWYNLIQPAVNSTALTTSHDDVVTSNMPQRTPICATPTPYLNCPPRPLCHPVLAALAVPRPLVLLYFAGLPLAIRSSQFHTCGSVKCPPSS